MARHYTPEHATAVAELPLARWGSRSPGPSGTSSERSHPDATGLDDGEGTSPVVARHYQAGEPLSDKSKVVAGLLQLLGLFGLVGIGRIYLGYTGLGIAQLAVGLITCGLGAVVWGIIDAVLILTDKVRDPAGRPLRDGT